MYVDNCVIKYICHHILYFDFMENSTMKSTKMGAVQIKSVETTVHLPVHQYNLHISKNIAISLHIHLKNKNAINLISLRGY